MTLPLADGWTPTLVSVEQPALLVRHGRVTMVARGMTGTVEFDGNVVTICPDSLVDDRLSAPLTLPLKSIGAVEWWPACTTHRGILRFAPPHVDAGPVQLFDLDSRLAPVEDELSVSFKLRQQDDFETLRDAVCARLTQPLHPVTVRGRW